MTGKYILIATLFILSGSTLADDQTPGEGAMNLQDMDIDGDGTLTAEEASSNVEIMSNWNSLDTNQDGVMDSSEFSAFEETQSNAKGANSTPGYGANPGSNIE